MNAPLALNFEDSNSEHFLDALDRLVAGELDEDRRSRLLAWLDERPERWKTCAMAFLEAQVWEQAFDSRMAESAHSLISPPLSHELNGRAHWPAPKPAPAKNRSPVSRRRLVMGLAALVAISFALGAAAGRFGLAPGDQSPPFAESQQDNDRQPAPDSRRDADSASGLVATVSVGGATGRGAGITLQLPVVEPARRAERPAPREIPEHVRRQWLRQGWDLEPVRKYLPARLGDGTPVFVPIDRVQPKYVGKPVS